MAKKKAAKEKVATKGHEVLVLNTSRNKKDIIATGHVGTWQSNLERTSRCPLVICTQLRTHEYTYSDPTEPSGTAFLVLKNSGAQATDTGTTPVPTEYALANYPNFWPGHRNPFTYIPLDTLPFDPETLEYHPFPIVPTVPAGDAPDPQASEPVDPAALPAKLTFAGPGGVVIEITIRAA